jgi:hypothetical protein
VVKLNLQNSIYTPQDLRSLIMEIRRYSRWFAQTSIKNKVTNTTSNEPLFISELGAALIHDMAASQPLTQKILDELIASLEELEKTVPKITITLAALPGNNLKKTITEWCRKNITADILVDFRFNATLLGGMVVQHGSHIYDWSFRRAILANRTKFPEVLRRV